jgi:hypothetical protein
MYQHIYISIYMHIYTYIHIGAADEKYTMLTQVAHVNPGNIYMWIYIYIYVYIYLYI